MTLRDTLRPCRTPSQATLLGVLSVLDTNAGAKFNELQLLRAEHGVKKYPAMWPSKDATDHASTRSYGCNIFGPGLEFTGFER